MLLLWSFPGLSQVTNGGSEGAVEMADVMRSSGKIYVVVLIVALVFAGISLYLVLLDRKVGRLEKEMEAFKEVAHKEN